MKFLTRSVLLRKWNGYSVIKSSSIPSDHMPIKFQHRPKKSEVHKDYFKIQYKDQSGRLYFPHYKVYTLDRVGSFVKNLNDFEKQALFLELQKYTLDLANKGEANLLYSYK